MDRNSTQNNSSKRRLSPGLAETVVERHSDHGYGYHTLDGYPDDTDTLTYIDYPSDESSTGSNSDDPDDKLVAPISPEGSDDSSQEQQEITNKSSFILEWMKRASRGREENLQETEFPPSDSRGFSRSPTPEDDSDGGDDDDDDDE